LIKKVLLLLVAAIWSLGLAAFYLIPAFLEKNLTQIDRILGGYFNYNFHFLYIRQFFWENWGYGGSILGLHDDMSFFLGYGQILALGFLIMLLLVTFARKVRFSNLANNLVAFLKQHFLIFGLMIILIVCLFLTTFKSKIIWDNLPILSYIQFPWRFLMPAAIILGLLNAAVMQIISRSKFRLWVFWILLILLSFNSGYFRFQHQTNYYEKWHKQQ
jgi:hypothetical protein